MLNNDDLNYVKSLMEVKKPLPEILQENYPEETRVEVLKSLFNLFGKDSIVNLIKETNEDIKARNNK